MMGDGGMYGISWFWMIIPTLLVLGFAFWMIARGSEGRSHVRGDSPQDILDRRYAAGEIDKDEYERRKRDIAGVR